MSDKVAKRLAEITVDVKSVQKPDAAAATAAAAAADAAMTAPLPAVNAADLRPATLKYKGTMALGAQKIVMDMSRAYAPVTEKGRGCWCLVDAATMPMGAIADTVVVDQQTLRPIRRGMSGLGTMQVVFGDKAITGKAGGGGQMMDVDVPLQAPAITDGPAFDAYVACLPLADGFSATMPVFDSGAQKVRPLKITVKGQETTTVSAGSFPTWILDLATLDGDPAGSGTVRVLQSTPHHVVEGEYKLPASMGGGLMTAELVTAP
jgi:hypothetical protein